MKMNSADMMKYGGGLLIVALLGGGALYWTWSTYSANIEELTSTTSRLNSIARSKTVPTQQNLEIVKANIEDTQAVIDLILPVLKKTDAIFDPIRTAPGKGLNPNAWQRTLSSRLDAINKLAEQKSITLGSNFHNFERFLGSTPSDAHTLQLGVQLLAMDRISHILIESGALSINEISRSPVENEGSSGAAGRRSQSSKSGMEVLDGPQNYYRIYPMQVRFECKPPAFRKAFNRIMADEIFFILRFLSVKNEKNNLPMQSELDQRTPEEGSESEKLFFVVAGEERITVTLWLDMLVWNHEKDEGEAKDKKEGGND